MAGPSARAGASPPRDVSLLAQALDIWYTRLGRVYGPLSRPQRRMLHLIKQAQSTRVGALAERLGLTMAGATRMLDRLEEQGYLVRTRAVPGQGDKREVYISLTDAGQAALQAADTVFEQHVRASITHLTAEQVGQLTVLLRLVTQPPDEPAPGERSEP